MPHSDPSAYSRRSLLKHGVLMASASVTIPVFLERSSLVLAQALGGLSSAPGIPDERVLVVLQLSGGNDGLNTIVPFFSPEYYKMRAGIAIPKQEALPLSRAEGIGLHPAMGQLRELYDEGMVGIVQGVGYPNPNRSHFKSMDIWHTADTSATGNGWLGRFLDSECCGEGKGESGTPERDGGSPPAIAIGRSAPLAAEGSRIRATSFESADLFRWAAGDIDKDLEAGYEALNRRGGAPRGEGEHAGQTNADFLMRTALDAQLASDQIRKAVSRTPATPFPQTEVGQQLAMVASMIRAGLKTRVYYLSLGGFDTHATQGGAQGRHANLLRQYSEGVRAFWKELKAQGNDQRVLMMTFSEFGRRVGQNQSQGTDHGTAAPMFLVGPSVRAGVLTDHPSMRDLDEGDLKYTTDFRGVYAGILEQWLKADSQKVLEGRHRALRVVRGS